VFQITDSASKQFKHSANLINETDPILRIAAKMTPEQGILYKMGFDTPNEDDVSYNINDISFVVDKESDKLIDGMIIDYRELSDQEQFVFVNPNDKTQCDSNSKVCDSNDPSCQGCLAE
jgi:iron-sulfur cluster assembly protein